MQFAMAPIDSPRTMMALNGVGGAHSMHIYAAGPTSAKTGEKRNKSLK